MFYNCVIFVVLNLKKREYNTIIEHISTPVPTVDNIRIQIYMHTYIIDKKTLFIGINKKKI